MAQTVKHLPAMWETWVRSLGQEDPLEKEIAIHSSTRAWKIPWTEEPDRLQSMGSQRVGHKWSSGFACFLQFNSEFKTTHGRVNTKIKLIILFAAKDGEALYSQQKQDWELTVTQIINFLLPNSGLN